MQDKENAQNYSKLYNPLFCELKLQTKKNIFFIFWLINIIFECRLQLKLFSKKFFCCFFEILFINNFMKQKRKIEKKIFFCILFD